jgi:hypothetical protein
MKMLDQNQMGCEALSEDGSKSREPLQRLLHTTEQMLGHAERLEWDEMEQLQVQRNIDLKAGLGNPSTAPDTESVRDTLASLLSLNDSLVKKVAQARSEVLQNSRKLQQSRSGARNYQQLQNSTRT